MLIFFPPLTVALTPQRIRSRSDPIINVIRILKRSTTWVLCTILRKAGHAEYIREGIEEVKNYLWQERVA